MISKKIIFALITGIIIVSIVSVTVVLNTQIDEQKFISKINRHVPSDEYLSLLIEKEKIDENTLYFDSLNTSVKSPIENLSKLIEREYEFLNNYKPRDYSKWGKKYHKFIYNASLQINQDISLIKELVEERFQYPTFYFFYDWETQEYIALSNIMNEYDSNLENWNISKKIDNIFAELDPLVITQTVVISDIYAPLAGTGTEFQRLFLCDPQGKPLFFLSTEGYWWLS
ncbi:MAG: hypothetical protein ACTSPI_02050 [Candidatus Heimdallarchaeaceae archaeon]